jgi:hypothetical protein
VTTTQDAARPNPLHKRSSLTLNTTARMPCTEYRWRQHVD